LKKLAIDPKSDSEPHRLIQSLLSPSNAQFSKKTNFSIPGLSSPFDRPDGAKTGRDLVVRRNKPHYKRESQFIIKGEDLRNGSQTTRELDKSLNTVTQHISNRKPINLLSKIANLINKFHPSVKIKNFNEVKEKSNYIEILNDTIKHAHESMIFEINEGHNKKEIFANNLESFELKARVYAAFKIPLEGHDPPLRVYLKPEKGSNSSYELFYSYTIGEPSLFKGYDKKFLNERVVTIFNRTSEAKFADSYIYMSLFSGSATKVQLIVKFSKKLMARDSQIFYPVGLPDPADEAPVFERKKPIAASVVVTKNAIEFGNEVKDKQYFEEMNKKLFGDISYAEKRRMIQEIKRKRQRVNSNCSKDFISKNIESIQGSCSTRAHLVLSNGEKLTQVYDQKLLTAKLQKKEKIVRQQEYNEYHSERDDIKRKLLLNLRTTLSERDSIKSRSQEFFKIICLYLFLDLVKECVTSHRNQIKEFVKNMIISRKAVSNMRNMITYDQQTTYNERIHIQTKYFFEFSMKLRSEDPRDRAKKGKYSFFSKPNSCLSIFTGNEGGDGSVSGLDMARLEPEENSAPGQTVWQVHQAAETESL
jgi:hypothetical protein